MAEAIVTGLFQNKNYPYHIYLCDLREDRLSDLKKKFTHVTTTLSNIEGVSQADIIFLSVKPQQMAQVLQEIKDEYRNQLIISIAAGISIKKIQKYLTNNAPIVRVMPNTPALIQKGISGVAFSNAVSELDKKITLEILTAIGQVIVLKESDLDAVTALSGSGPAYFFAFINAMINAGIELGLSKDVSKALVIATGMGALEMTHSASEDLVTLIKKVTSPGGTTEAALAHFKEKNWENIIEEAIKKACHRSNELREMP